MNWKEYKRYCSRPDYFSRWALLESAVRSQSSEVAAALLQAVDAQTPLVKPQGHKGGPETDYFRLSVSADVTSQVIEELERSLTGLEGKTYRLRRHLLDVWYEYLKFLDTD